MAGIQYVASYGDRCYPGKQLPWKGFKGCEGQTVTNRSPQWNKAAQMARDGWIHKPSNERDEGMISPVCGISRTGNVTIHTTL